MTLIDNLRQVYNAAPEFVHWLFNTLYRTLSSPLIPSNRLYWVYLLSGFIIGGISYYYYQRNKGQSKPYLHLFGFLVPHTVYLHPSSLVDYQLFIVNRFFTPLTRLTMGIISTTLIAAWVMQQLAVFFPEWNIMSISAWSIVLGTVLYAMVDDFSTFINHWLHHKYWFLWPLHSVHHSAEVLNPVTLYRKHPLYDIVKYIIKSPITGLFQGLIAFFILGISDVYTILGLNIVYAIFNILGANLRHTHIWISYGTVLNHIFVSPAHHQIHHSASPAHRDCNLGGVFALWDWMFGSLVLPSEEIRKNLVFGLNMEEAQRHPSLQKAYLEPLGRIIGSIRTRISSSGKPYQPPW
jgi:sterol desaturase/sphingolipid hydroxylase (fatty acid hydroxylase superfamily)